MAEMLQVRFPRHRKPVWCGPRKSRVRNSLQNISANERCLKRGGPAAGVGKRPSASPDSGDAREPRGEITSRPRATTSTASRVLVRTETLEPRRALVGMGNDPAAAANRRQDPKEILFSSRATVW